MLEQIKDLFKSIYNTVADFIVRQIAKVNWRQTRPITEEQKQKIMEMLKDNYFIITTRRRNHLSTYAIAFATFFLTGRWGYYSHVLMNLEDSVSSVDDFRLVEAVGNGGAKYSTFEEVFDGIDGVCLMKPRAMTIDEWTTTLDKAKSMIGTPYDTLYDLSNDKAVSCVELVRDILSVEPNYKTDFANFENLITRSHNLVPQMFRDCADFEPVLEIRIK